MSELYSPEAEVRGRYFLKCGKEDGFIVYDPAFSLFRFDGDVLSKKVTLGHANGKLLEVLVSAGGRMLSREEIFLVAWPGRIVTQNSLNQAILVLRRLFEDRAGRIIQTVPRGGYLFNAEFIVDDSDENKDILNRLITTLNQQSSEEHQLTTEAVIDPEPVAKNGEANFNAATMSVQSSVSTRNASFLQWFLMLSITLLTLLLLFRLYYIWEEKNWFETVSIVNGEQTVVYVASDAFEIETLRRNTEVLSKRFERLAQGESFLIINKMHSYYDVICVGDKVSPRFILIHEQRIKSLSDEQIVECLI